MFWGNEKQVSYGNQLPSPIYGKTCDENILEMQ